MSAATHTLLLVTYGIVAACLALVLPQSVRGVDPTMASLLGICTFMGLAIAHEIWARREAVREVGENMRRHAEQIQALREWNSNIAADVEQLRRTLTKVAHEADQSGLIAEMQLLQDHLDRLSQGAERLDAIDTNFIMRTGGNNDIVEPTNERELLSEIREGLSANRVDLYLQPIVTVPQRKVEYYEAFSRIRTANGGILRPEDYLALATRENLIGLIDNLLSFRCVQLVRRRLQRNKPIMCFVNLSASLLAEPEFFAPFKEFLTANQNLASNLCFDLAQADVLERWELIGGSVDEIAKLGFRFSLDQVEHLDMPFNELARRHIVYVKAPAEVLLAPPGEVQSRYASLDLKEAMSRHGLTLIAHKIETERQLVEVLDLEVELGQGYLFGEPKPARDA
ncbi:MAG: EAL domain-containing protein [Alphaproteobacteria bacterium]